MPYLGIQDHGIGIATAYNYGLHANVSLYLSMEMMETTGSHL